MQATRNLALVALYTAGFNMDSYTGMMQSIFYIFLQVVTHLVCFIYTGVFWQDQVEVYVTLASCLPSAQLMKADYIRIMLCNARLYLSFLCFR